MTEDSFEAEKTLFNLDLAHLQRVDALMNNIDDSLFIGDYNGAYRMVRLMKGNLNPLILKKKEYGIDVQKAINEIDSKLQVYNNNYPRRYKKKLSDELFFLILGFKEMLLQIMHECDTIMTKKDDASHVMLR